uniref:Uncharacterized protein n=1 Tax=Amphora coffeiformis TaxID=265554 RepID=A0A7S3PAA7_9STRA
MNRSPTVECTTLPPLIRQPRPHGLVESDQIVRGSSSTWNNIKPRRRSISPLTNKKTLVANASCTSPTRYKAATIRRPDCVATRPKICSVSHRPTQKKQVASNPVRRNGISLVADVLSRQGPPKPDMSYNKRCTPPTRITPLFRRKDDSSKTPSDPAGSESPSRPKGCVSPHLRVRQEVERVTQRKRKIPVTRSKNVNRQVRFCENANEYYHGKHQINDTQIENMWYSKLDIATFQQDIKRAIHDIRLTEAYWSHPRSLPGTLLRMYLTFRHAITPEEVISPVASVATPIQHSPYLIGLEGMAIPIIPQDYLHRRQCLLLQLNWIQSQLPDGTEDQSADLRAAFRHSSRTSRLFARYIADLSAATPFED